MQRLLAIFRFKFMVAVFRLRDWLRPRRQVLQEVGIRPGFPFSTTGAAQAALSGSQRDWWANPGRSTRSTSVPWPSRRRDGGYDAFGGHLARQDAGIAVLERPLRPGAISTVCSRRSTQPFAWSVATWTMRNQTSGTARRNLPRETRGATLFKG